MHVFLKLVTFSCFLLFPMLAFSAAEEVVLPPILDYYPNCEYQVIKETSVIGMVKGQELAKTTKRLLNQLQQKAIDAGANGVIIMDKKIEELDVLDEKGEQQQIRFFAKLIVQCKQEEIAYKMGSPNAIHQKFTAYNHEGVKAKSMMTFKLASSDSRVGRPKVINTEISLANGLYGVKLGDSYQQVIKKFGEPNVQLTLLADELIIGYGRHHWLHFQLDKLVKVQSTLPYLSASILNKIPLLDFFDANAWKINNKVGQQALLEDVYPELALDKPLNEKNQLVLNSQDKVLILNFIASKNSHTNEKKYTLGGFSMERSNYKESLMLPFDDQVIQNEAITQAYLALVSNKDINVNKLAEQLGEVKGRIVLQRGGTMHLYNQHLMLKVNATELVEIHLLEEVFINDNANSNSKAVWALGDFIQGGSFEQLQKSFPDDAYESNYGIEIPSVGYSLFLLFDDYNNRKPLYEAVISVY
ncbi:MAG: hypothetical protein V7780_02225 [Colwellia sp.]|jgi:hypothetical protein|uniref:hypothetical protein n=1 Tax=Colwellia sp. Bg11-12 TaxID=2759817 RepID=UPI0015F6B486|nr:hypothetical protein [Colwellia sp. Bg11-12]MBA6262589.1 hypothetical protein [Colwellia sp. Bg11-12]